MSNIYCIDTSALIDSRINYPFANFPTFWSDLEGLIKDKRLMAPQEVREEIDFGDDELSQWAKCNKQMFNKLDKRQTQLVTDILKRFPNLVDQKKQIDADPFLIALALKIREDQLYDKCIIVSHEIRKPNRHDIPNVCGHYGIECIKIVEVVQNEGWRF